MDGSEQRFLTIIDDKATPLSDVSRKEIRNASGTGIDKPHPAEVTTQASDNLRVILSKLYEHNLVWMPIVDDDNNYQGEISQDDIARHLSAPAL